MGIVRNIFNNDLYEYVGENKFINLRTGKEGVVDDEKAREVFRINLEATQIIAEFPLVKELIKILKLRSDGVLGMQEKK